MFHLRNFGLVFHHRSCPNIYLSTHKKVGAQMRFLYKRPQLDLVNDELNTVMEVMASDLFIYLDLFVFSLIFTLLLAPVLKSIILAAGFLVCCYCLFSGVYYFIFSRTMEKS